jgi:hypothetical protein
VIGLADRAPQAALPKQRNDVILIAWQRLDIHQPGRFAMIDECRDSEDRRLRAMGGARLQHATRRHAGVALELEIGRQLFDEGLNLLRRVEARERPVLGRRQQRA